MENTLGLGMAIVGLILSVGASAMLWEKADSVRKLPLYYCLAFGLLYLVLHQNELTLFKTIEIVIGSFLAGLILYFAVWIQCKNKGDKFY